MGKQKEANNTNKKNQISQEKIKKIIEELESHNDLKQNLILNFLQQEETLSHERTIETLEKVTKHLKKIKKEKPKETITKYSIPITIFSNRTLSTLEHIITYLKEHHKMRYKEIALLLNRDQRTVWTTYQRAKKKRG